MIISQMITKLFIYVFLDLLNQILKDRHFPKLFLHEVYYRASEINGNLGELHVMKLVKIMVLTSFYYILSVLHRTG